jgi:hypothetical protein
MVPGICLKHAIPKIMVIKITEKLYVINIVLFILNDRMTLISDLLNMT